MKKIAIGCLVVFVLGCVVAGGLAYYAYRKVSVTAAAVSTLSATRLRYADSTQTPTAGASTATVSPAMAAARPSQLAGVVGPAIPIPTLLVR